MEVLKLKDRWEWNKEVVWVDYEWSRRKMYKVEKGKGSRRKLWSSQIDWLIIRGTIKIIHQIIQVDTRK